MTAAVAPRCTCGHVGFRHLGGLCRARFCQCTRFAEAVTDDLDAAVQRHPSGRASIPDYLRTDDLTAYRRQKGEL